MWIVPMIFLGTQMKRVHKMLPVVYLPPAERYFRKLKDKQLKSKFREAVSCIRSNPRRGEAKSGDLRGLYSLDIYHNKTNYEMAYRIANLDDGQMIVVIMAGTRDNFYKELKRYLK